MAKVILSLALVLTIFFSPISFGIAQDVLPLTNADILKMVKATLTPEQIIGKINSSSTAFDTFPTVIEELRYKGVPDEVLAAMIEAPRVRRPAQPKSVALPTPVKTADGAGSRNSVEPPVTSQAPEAVPTPTIPQSTAETKRSPSSGVWNPKQLKEKKIRGYITEFSSPTSVEIEDYRITRDESVVFEFENQNAEVSFKKEDLRIGTLVEIRGLFDETTSELRATRIKIDLDQFRQLDVTTILDRKPLELQQSEIGWRGLIAADGRRVRIEPETKMLFRPNRSEKERAKDDQKAESEKKKHELDPDNDDWTKMSKSRDGGSWASDGNNKLLEEDFITLQSLADIGPGTVMTYH